MGESAETRFLGFRPRWAGILWEQELARLFVRSGWTQEQLAAKEHKSQKWIDFYVRFGRFLTFSTTVLNPWISRLTLFGRFLDFAPMGANAETLPNNLSERRFRAYWERSEKAGGNERQRFGALRGQCGLC
jgi:hypothetical protein